MLEAGRMQQQFTNPSGLTLMVCCALIAMVLVRL